MTGTQANTFFAVIELTQGKVALVDEADLAWLSQWKWQATKCGSKWYAKRSPWSKGKTTTLYMHRQILDAGPLDVDHRDRNGLNNQRSNLRAASRSQNLHNTRSTGASGFKGVTWHKDRQRWVAQIQTNGKHRYLGLFDTPQDAAAAYDQAALDHYGADFAVINDERRLKP